MDMTKTQGLRWAALGLMALAALLALRLALGLRGAGAPGGRAGQNVAAVPEPFRWPVMEAGAWKIFRSGEPLAPPAAAGALAARFRLAGVFLVLSDPDHPENETRCAILDDLQTKQQVLASEGEETGAARVVSIAFDHVVLSNGEKEETIYLAAGTLPGHGTADAATVPAAEAPKILETNRFGNRIGETRWEFNRQAMLDYYQEMMDNPERLAALFMAMEPDRDEAGKVAGYKLNLDVGEKDFYTQVGLQQGDVVRKVNSMRMTSQRRAEYFIGEFVQNRLGAVVFDIERNGEAKKLVYLIK
jgi:type II secretory pathway component PulC